MSNFPHTNLFKAIFLFYNTIAVLIVYVTLTKYRWYNITISYKYSVDSKYIIFLIAPLFSQPSVVFQPLICYNIIKYATKEAI